MVCGSFLRNSESDNLGINFNKVLGYYCLLELARIKLIPSKISLNMNSSPIL